MCLTYHKTESRGKTFIRSELICFANDTEQFIAGKGILKLWNKYHLNINDTLFLYALKYFKIQHLENIGPESRLS